MTEGGLTPALLDALAAGDAELDRGARGPEAEVARLRRVGLLRAPLPPALGGQGWGTTPEASHDLRRALESLGGVSLSIARIYEGHANAVRLVVDHGTDAQRLRLGQAVRDGALMGVWGADPPGDPVLTEGGRLHGRKAFASGVGAVSLAIVTAHGDGGLAMVLADATDVSRHSPGDWDMDGMVGSRSGGFDCTGLPAGPDERLGAPGALLLDPAFHGGIWRLVACYAGAMASLAQQARAAAARRGVADDPLTRRRLGEIALEAHTARLWSLAACEAVETGEDADVAVMTTLFAREAVEQAAGRQMDLIERLGGTAIHRRGASIGRQMRDLRVYLRQAQLDGKLSLATSLWEAGGGPPAGN